MERSDQDDAAGDAEREERLPRAPFKAERFVRSITRARAGEPFDEERKAGTSSGLRR